GSRNRRLVGEGVDALAKQLGFRTVDGFAERVVYREFFPRGLTALDNLNEDTLGLRPNSSHLTARDEVKILIDALRLPIDERGKRRAAARAEWIAATGKPLATSDPLADRIRCAALPLNSLYRSNANSRRRGRPPAFALGGQKIAS